MEVTQYTYFQRSAASTSTSVAGELTYGLERLAMYVQGVDNVYDLTFNDGGRRPMARSSWRTSASSRQPTSTATTSTA